MLHSKAICGIIFVFVVIVILRVCLSVFNSSLESVPEFVFLCILIYFQVKDGRKVGAQVY